MNKNVAPTIAMLSLLAMLIVIHFYNNFFTQFFFIFLIFINIYIIGRQLEEVIKWHRKKK